MNMHKRIRLTPLDRQEIWRIYGTGDWTIAALAREGSSEYQASPVYKVIHRARSQEFAPRKSTNKRLPLLKGETKNKPSASLKH